MAVIADYINMSVSLVLSNKQGTDVEYRLPNDIRKQFDDFALPDGYEMVRGTIANAATVTIGPSNNDVICYSLFLSDACDVRIFDDDSDVTLKLASLVLSTNKDEDLRLKDVVSSVTVENNTGASVEYTYIALNT